MLTLSLQELAQITQGRMINVATDPVQTVIRGISQNSQTIQAENLFIAIRGERFDGHRFLMQAQQNGATAALVDTHQPDCTLAQIVVPDTIVALGQLANAWRERFQLPIIAVTGTCGKTTIKNMLASILYAACDGDTSAVLANRGNFNNAIGMPLTLSELGPQHRYAVLEMGMNHPGEIAYLTATASPTVAVISNAGAGHLAGVGNVADVAKAKGEIFQGLAADGVAIINRDSPFYAYWCDLIPSQQVLCFGWQQQADVRATLLSEDESGLNCFELSLCGQSQMIKLPLPGKHNIENALAAAAAAHAVGIDLAVIAEGLRRVENTPGRLAFKPGIKACRIIDDTYNANPNSVLAAIDVLSDLNDNGRRILVLGDMLELGDEANQWHRRIGVEAATRVDRFYGFGPLMQYAVNGFNHDSRAQHFEDKNDLIAALQQELQPGDHILVKGSRGMHMEQVVQALCDSDRAC